MRQVIFIIVFLFLQSGRLFSSIFYQNTGKYIVTSSAKFSLPASDDGNALAFFATENEDENDEEALHVLKSSYFTLLFLPFESSSFAASSLSSHVHQIIYGPALVTKPLLSEISVLRL